MSPTRSRTPVPWIVAGVVVVLLGVVAVVASTGGGDDETSDATVVSADVSVTGDALPPLGEGGDAAVGATAPTLAGSGFDGGAVTIEPGDGTAKVVLFVAHWCPHCQNEVPFLVDHLAGSPLPDGVELVTVSTSVDDRAPNYPPDAWLEEEGWDFPVLADSESGAAATAYGLTSFPYFVAVGADGTVVERASGELTGAEFDALVEAARAG